MGLETTFEWVGTDDLWFDARNPRLSQSDEPLSQDEILEVLWREFAVDEIALSIVANGFFEHEPLFVAKEGGHLVVVEGNRRLAAVRLLREAGLRQKIGATDLPRASKKILSEIEQLPVVQRKRSAIWQYVGFKHVNGPQAWQSYSKAQYISWVHNELKIPLDQIARTIGDQHTTVRRLYRAWMVINQAEEAGVFSRDDRYRKHFSFSHLYTGLNYSGIQTFLGLSPGKEYSKRPVPKIRLRNLADLCLWLFGSKSRNQPPLVQSQNPDLKTLDDILLSKNGTAALRSGLPLQVSLEVSKGDEQLFREALVRAKVALQEARGKLLTGYSGESDLLGTADDVKTLAIGIREEMFGMTTSKRKSVKRTGSRR